jgi:hypothetical protein
MENSVLLLDAMQQQSRSLLHPRKRVYVPLPSNNSDLLEYVTSLVYPWTRLYFPLPGNDSAPPKHVTILSYCLHLDL